jgi:glycosyltransferase involved in cell wall biosynthesis
LHRAGTDCTELENMRETKTPLLSIITVVYNDAANLKKTIDSVKSQSFSDYELVVIDGKSTDGTLVIIESNKEHIASWISESDNGIYDAMNKGIRIACGRYIEFLNAGDVFVDSKSLERIFLNNDNDYDILYGEINLYDKSGMFLCRVPARDFTLDNLKSFGTGTVNHQAFIIKRELAPHFSNKYQLKGELNWYFDILLNHKDLNFKHVAFPLIDYRQGGKGYKEFWRNFYEWVCLIQSKFGLMQNIRNRKTYWNFIKYRYTFLRKLSNTP